MIVMTVEYHVKPGEIDNVLLGLRQMDALVKQDEPGCLGYQVLRSTDVPDRLFLIETYTDMAALEAHRVTPHFKDILEARVIPLLENRIRHFYTPEIQ